jgi:hypothetical protein
MIVLIDGVRYELVTPESEAWLEKAIESSCGHIFGPDSFYFDIKKQIKSKAGVASIPDGYVIFFTPKARWAVIEVELASHSVYKHLIPQLTKFNRGIEDSTTRKQLQDALYRILEEDGVLKAKLKRKIQSGEVFKFLSDVVSQNPLIVVVIDRKTEELTEALGDIRADVEVVEFKTFRREGVSEDVNAFLFEPLNKKGPGPEPGPEYSKFWEPIRREGLFKGKPVRVRDEGWISKGIRGIDVALQIQEHKCFVIVSFKGKDRLKRRDKAVALFPDTEYQYEVNQSPKFARVRFRVLDKGKKDREDWSEIRGRLVTLGTDVFNKIAESNI